MDFTIKLVGTAPLLMHSSRLSNPLDPVAKAMKRVTGKRKKSDEDYEELARLEFGGSMYFDSEVGPFIPADNIWRALYDAAKKTRRGPKVKESVFIDSDVNRLDYEGPRDDKALWLREDFRHISSVKVGPSRVMRTRPIFRDWSVEAHGILDTVQLDFQDLVEIAEVAGSQIGLGDWRPRYGRFVATVEKA